MKKIFFFSFLLIFLFLAFINAQECNELWLCSWGECKADDYKYAYNCTDLNYCGTEFTKPTRKSCVEAVICKEDWKCKWSECKVDGYSYAYDCTDKSACNTTFLKPYRSKCEEKKPKPEEKFPVPEGCIPEWQCEEAECKIFYNINKIETRKERLCIDRKGCMPSKIEEEACIEKREIETKEIFENGSRIVEIIDEESKNVVARVEYGEREGKPYLDINLVALPGVGVEKIEERKIFVFPFFPFIVISIIIFLALVLFFSRRRKKIKIEKMMTGEELKKEASKRLKKINTKKKNAFEDFEFIFHVFLKNFFKIRYEFTHAELEKELQRKKISEELKEGIISLSKDIYDVKFGGKKDKKNVGMLIKRARKIIKAL